MARVDQLGRKVGIHLVLLHEQGELSQWLIGYDCLYDCTLPSIVVIYDGTYDLVICRLYLYVFNPCIKWWWLPDKVQKSAAEGTGNVLMMCSTMVCDYKSLLFSAITKSPLTTDFHIRNTTSTCLDRDINWSVDHGSNGSPFLDGSCGSWVTASDWLTHYDEIHYQYQATYFRFPVHYLVYFVLSWNCSSLPQLVLLSELEA